MDESYHTYLNRVAKMTLPATYESQIKNIQESPKFRLTAAGTREPVPFPGYSAITPPGAEDRANSEVFKELAACQQHLVKTLEPDLLVLVDPASFHFTLADLIWDSAYRGATEANTDFESELVDRIEDSFKIYQNSIVDTTPIRWQIMGLTVRPRAIEVSLVPKDEYSYDRIIAFRRAIYQNSSLISLGIEQQYYFTAHTTLAYFGNVEPRSEGLCQRELDRARLSDTLQEYNMHWLDRPQEIILSEGQLRNFTDMYTYERKPHFPIVKL
ncbi:hypothetical protein [Chamaesiphon minutus]|uniref:DUF1868 domain-containing protein n=1 Tax=Chamaesiphon minutus (strain ATCC 27169 / PCC 6605) TaxID=1173020 RepID=K9UK80_CHAP6|nr:hypothetical protein [Chamaesiphon minutus]AFY94609.1 hypothetical protein Cha6605_3626 [Chamaesiphon minutus PCC 6605]